ncbi:hypothetical protein QQG55_49020 [Brugia pahangi]
MITIYFTLFSFVITETRLTSTDMYNIDRLTKNINRNGTKATPTSTYSNNFIKSLPSFSTNQRWFIKNINSNGKKAISKSTYSNDFIKSQPSISTKQHRFMKNVKNIHNGTKATSTLAHINDDIAVNNSNNVNKLLLSTHKKKLVPLVAYGIYRPVSYYDLSEWTFRILNGYDDGYLIQIFEDCDYVIFTKIVKVNKPENFVVSPPPKANVIIVNEKYLINENKIHIMDLNSPYVTKQKYLLKKNSE